MENKGKVLMQRYDFGRLLGQGNFAKVYHGRDLKSGQSVAIKAIDKEKVFKVGLIEQTKREISVLGLVKHPNVVQLYEVMATKTKIYIVMEYAKGGELFNKVAKGRLKEDVARKYFLQLISAVDFCHGRGVYHRDLKPENLLLDENGNLKVTDFGLSALSNSRRQDGLLHTTCGTPAYVAPEVINRKGYDGVKADIWSCGVVLFVLLAGYLPFHDSNLMEMYRKISKAEYKCPNWFPSDVRRLLVRILDPNPHTRISISKIRENPWFKKGFDSNNQISKPMSENGVVKNPDLFSGSSSSDIDEAKPTNLNAFDIISLSTGFDLSGLFVENDEKEEVQFTSTKPVSEIMLKIGEIAGKLEMKLKKKEGGLIKLERSNEGLIGELLINIEIFEIAPFFHLVEVKRAGGDAVEYKKMMKQSIKPTLEGIVWAWQGQNRHDQHQNQ